MTVKNRLMIVLLYGPFHKKWLRCNTWNVCFFSAILYLILNSCTLNWMCIHMQLNVEASNLFFHPVNIFVYYSHEYISRRVHTAKCINKYITGEKKLTLTCDEKTWNEPFLIVLSPSCLLFHSPYLYVFALECLLLRKHFTISTMVNHVEVKEIRKKCRIMFWDLNVRWVFGSFQMHQFSRSIIHTATAFKCWVNAVQIVIQKSNDDNKYQHHNTRCKCVRDMMWLKNKSVTETETESTR